MEKSLLQMICVDVSNNNYVNGLLNVGPVRAFTSGVGESFHPNSRGHQKIAQAIIDSKELEFTNTASSNGYEPNEKSINTQRIDMVERDQPKGGKLKAAIKSVFKPNSIAKVTLHSDPIDLGPMVANETGDVNFSIDTNELPLGNHLLVLEGVDLSEEPIRYYQFIEIFEEELVPQEENKSNVDEQERGSVSKINKQKIFEDNSTQNSDGSILDARQKPLLAYNDDDTPSDVVVKENQSKSSLHGTLVGDETKTDNSYMYPLLIFAILLTGAIFYVKTHKKI
jgi:hypothetical protein